AHPDRPPPAALTEAIAGWLAAASPRADGDALEELIAEWARFYGPFERALLERCFGLAEEPLQAALAALVDAERLVIDRFRRDEPERLEVCDAENLERLLRALRAASRPQFTALPLADLPLFLAHQQGLVGRGDGSDGLRRALEALFAYPAPAALWEGELLPARLDPYYPVWLDTLMQESELSWVGCGEERLTFLFSSDLELLAPLDGEGTAADAPLAAALQSGEAVSFEELARRTGLPSAQLAGRLWQAAWRGEVTAGGFQAVRQGILSRFAAPATVGVARAGARPTRRAFDRWKTGRPLGAAWLALPAPSRDLDALEREELAKDRARLLLGRYGVLFRELLARELPSFQWGGVFRALRLMELSGEVLAGHFFAGVPGPQFASPAAFRRLSEGFDREAIWWVNACDPAAPCGLALEALRGAFPPRLPSNHLVFRGERPLVVSRRHGAALEIAAAPTDPRASELFSFLEVLLSRQFDPAHGVAIESLDGEPAAGSSWTRLLAERFSLTREPTGLRLRRRY
ncbi:MAG: Lhr family helicase, partial [Thermoanaerobaculia bacterium]